jgi:hypothetical protein
LIYRLQLLLLVSFVPTGTLLWVCLGCFRAAAKQQLICCSRGACQCSTLRWCHSSVCAGLGALPARRHSTHTCVQTHSALCTADPAHGMHLFASSVATARRDEVARELAAHSRQAFCFPSAFSSRFACSLHTSCCSAHTSCLACFASCLCRASNLFMSQPTAASLLVRVAACLGTTTRQHLYTLAQAEPRLVCMHACRHAACRLQLCPVGLFCMLAGSAGSCPVLRPWFCGWQSSYTIGSCNVRSDGAGRVQAPSWLVWVLQVADSSCRPSITPGECLSHGCSLQIGCCPAGRKPE